MAGRGYKDRAITQKVLNGADDRKDHKKVCAICGKEFIPIDPRNKYCSLACKEAARKMNRDRWNDLHPEYRTKYMREYRKRLKEENEMTNQRK